MNLIKSLVAAVLSVAASIAFAAVDVNKASQAELESVKGIGPSMSGRILDARKSGAFNDWHDLQSRVKGLGDARALKLSGDGLTVNGAAYKAVTGKPSEVKESRRTKDAQDAKGAKGAKGDEKASKTPRA